MEADIILCVFSRIRKQFYFHFSLCCFCFLCLNFLKLDFYFQNTYRHPRINYSLAITMSLAGFLKSYLQLATDKKLNINRAICAYLAFGFGMSGIYYLVYASHLGCFKLPSDIAESASIIDFVYFSFVTITTVGYGDIVPRHTFVRSLVLFQVLFAVILVLRVSKINKESG